MRAYLALRESIGGRVSKSFCLIMVPSGLGDRKPFLAQVCREGRLIWSVVKRKIYISIDFIVLSGLGTTNWVPFLSRSVKGSHSTIIPSPQKQRCLLMEASEMLPSFPYNEARSTLKTELQKVANFRCA